MKKPHGIEKITVFNTPEESPGYLLWHVSLGWRSLIEATLKPLNLTHPQFVLLATTAWLTRKGNPVTQIEISKAAGLDPNTTSQVIRGLEAKTFISRALRVNEKSKNPSLTKLGQQVLSKALPAVEKADASFFEPLRAQNIELLLKLFLMLKHD